MKKIALMTWFQHNNYGTTLQALALMHKIKELGYDVRGIDYKSEGYNRISTIEKLTSPRKVLKRLKHIGDKLKYKLVLDNEKHLKYAEFKKKHLPMTEPCQTSSKLSKLQLEYDAFVCGSDQIWTPLEYNPKYFLDFVDNPNKMVAYAPSMGLCKIDNPYVKSKLGESVKRFRYLSVRENQSAELLSNEFNIHAEVVLDPTLLLDKGEWVTYSKEPNINEKYLLCYFLGNKEYYWKQVKALSDKYHLPVYIIPIYNKDYYRPYQILKGVSPEEFLGLFRGASFVCTDSYHGTIFSIINHVEFITFKRFSDRDKGSQNSRVYNLLEMLDLNNRLFNKTNSEQIEAINWKKVDALLDKKKSMSCEYLRRSLQSAVVPIDSNIEKYEITNTCSGCGICQLVCPKNAISLSIQQGFYQAKVDDALCIRCRCCKKVCAFDGSNGIGVGSNRSRLFMARSTSPSVLKTSTSGGICYELSNYLVNRGYYNWGCIFDDELGIVKHIMIDPGNKEKLIKFQGSKYLQSLFDDRIEKFLEKEKGVVFGTPCQIGALSNYLELKKIRSKFVLIELICYGVPSVNLWKKYLKEIGYEGKRLKEIHFRYKPKGWNKKYIYLSDGNYTHLKPEAKDLFYMYFNNNNCLMRSCYECNYKDESKADIRVGDYWGPKGKTYEKDGVSMVVSFTQKGIILIKELENEKKIEITEQPCSDYVSSQGTNNPIIPYYYDELMFDLEFNNKSDLRQIMKKYFYMEYISRNISRLYHRLKARVRR